MNVALGLLSLVVLAGNPPALEPQTALNSQDQALQNVRGLREAFWQNPGVKTAADLLQAQIFAGQIRDGRDLMAQVQRELPKGPLPKELHEPYVALSKHTWKVTYHYTMTEEPPNRSGGHLRKRGYFEHYYRAETPYQKITCEVQDAEKVEEAKDSSDNTILRIWPKEETADVVMTITQTPYVFNVPAKQIKEQSSPYLGKTPMIDPSGEYARQFASQIDRTNIRTIVDSIDVILTKQIQFGGPSSRSDWDSEQIFKQRHGHCWEHTKAAAALFRAAGVPARRVLVLNIYPAENPQGTMLEPFTGGHVITEVQVDGIGWIPYEAGRPFGAVFHRYVPLATEVPDEKDPIGTPDSVFTWTYYGGGNGKETYRNVDVELVSHTLKW